MHKKLNKKNIDQLRKKEKQITLYIIITAVLIGTLISLLVSYIIDVI